jgi:hypothetical protein
MRNTTKVFSGTAEQLRHVALIETLSLCDGKHVAVEGVDSIFNCRACRLALDLIPKYPQENKQS